MLTERRGGLHVGFCVNVGDSAVQWEDSRDSPLTQSFSDVYQMGYSTK